MSDTECSNVRKTDKDRGLLSLCENGVMSFKDANNKHRSTDIKEKALNKASGSTEKPRNQFEKKTTRRAPTTSTKEQHKK